MTHRCWTLDEIVRAITANLVSDRARASAVALASCSKSVEEPALGEVWKSLSSLAPLVKCFPPEIWEVKDGKLASTTTGPEDVYRRINRFRVVFQESPAPYGMDSISTAVRVKGPTPGGILPGCSDLLGRPPSTPTLFYF